MRLLNVTTLSEAKKELTATIARIPRKIIEADLSSAQGAILAEDITAPFTVPDFRRSTVDGYAVIANNTHGASASIPVLLDVIEEVSIGEPARSVITPGTCAYVPTGAMVPEGADAMVMVEYCEAFDETSMAVYQSVPCGSNIVLPGDDMKEGDLILKSGTLLRFQEIGALAAMGISTVKVYSPYRATVISTGTELASLGNSLHQCQVYDSNSYAICAQARALGIEIVNQLLIPDQEDLLRHAFEQAISDSDFVIASGGSSQGKKDMTERLFDELSQDGVFTHGLALKPGKPTILAWDEMHHTAMIGLPGHPVAASTVFELLVKPAVLQKELPDAVVEANITVNLPTSPGRETCIPVTLKKTETGYDAEPILGRSGLWTILTRADGYILIDHNQEGIPAGAAVAVHLFTN